MGLTLYSFAQCGHTSVPHKRTYTFCAEPGLKHLINKMVLGHNFGLPQWPTWISWFWAFRVSLVLAFGVLLGSHGTMIVNISITRTKGGHSVMKTGIPDTAQWLSKLGLHVFVVGYDKPRASFVDGFSNTSLLWDIRICQKGKSAFHWLSCLQYQHVTGGIMFHFSPHHPSGSEKMPTFEVVCKIWRRSDVLLCSYGEKLFSRVIKSQ